MRDAADNTLPDMSSTPARPHRHHTHATVFISLVIAAVVAFGAWQTWAARRAALPADATVVRVVDGDTFVARWNGRDERIRIIGANTPELHVMTGGPVDCFGGEARDFTTSLLDGRRVHLAAEIERHDRYGRTLADVVLADGPRAGRDVATELVTLGFARTMPISPNVLHADALDAAQRTAAAERRGLWGACSGAHTNANEPAGSGANG